MAENVGSMSLRPTRKWPILPACRVVPATRHVAMVAFPGVQILDVTGPLEVFGCAARLLAEPGRRARRRRYRRRDRREPRRRADLLVRHAAGRRARAPLGHGRHRHAARRRRARGPPRPCAIARSLAWLRAHGAAGAAARLGLQRQLRARRGRPARRPPRHHALGVRAATLAARYPGVTRRRRIRSSSATATSTPRPASPPGMDLALALVEEDHGRELALEVARQLVLFLRRPGGQSQFSAQLAVADGRSRAAPRAAGVDRRASRRRSLGAGARAARGA